MSKKTYTTAVVLIPPEDCWEPIQKIRQLHDRKLHRWMPHITLIYPFRPRETFDELAPQLAEVCRRLAPINLRLAEFQHFHHRGPSYTVWLLPEPAEALVQLQAALQNVAPDCHEVCHHAHGFTPHLSIGQARGHDAMSVLKRTLQAYWEPLSFAAREISLLRRDKPPDDVFRVDRSIALEGQSGGPDPDHAS